MPASRTENVQTISASDKVRLVLEGLTGQSSVTELCHRSGISENTFNEWSTAFVEGGRKALSKNTQKIGVASEMKTREAELLRNVIDVCPANFMVSRIQSGEVLYRSQASAELLGELAFARGHWKNPEDRLRFVEILQSDGRVNNMFFSAVKADGTSFPCQISACIVEHQGENVIVSSTTDLSKEFALRKELEQANARFTEALEAFDEGFALWDSDLRLVLENERIFNMLYPNEPPPRRGQPGDAFQLILQEQFANKVFKLPEGVPADQVIGFWKQLITSYTKGLDIELEDGRILTGSSHETSLGGYLLTFKDVTDQRRAEAAEREADTLLKLIVDACPTNFMVSRIDNGKIIYLSNASTARFGEVDSKLSFFPRPEDRLKYLDALLPTGVVDDYPVRFRRGDGTMRDGLISARITRYKGEDVIVSATRDITEQLQLQTELQHQREIAHQNEKLSAMGELLAGVAHELNNPLSVVVGYALMLQEKLEDPAHKKRIERIGQSAERCARIVKVFLAMARQRPVDLEQWSLSDIIESAFDMTGFPIKSKGARVVFDLDASLPPVAADGDQLIQVFSNLISNAGHAIADSGKDGILTLKSYFDEDLQRVVGEVIDNGPGVPEELQTRIFEPFFTTKDAGAGTGIGLALCHRIVDTHGGRLSIKSKQSKGARFIVRLPQSETPARHFPPLKAQARTAGPLRVLVVDDQSEVADLLRDMLEDSGYQVEIRHDAQAALHLLDSETFDVILSDIKMPGLSGDAFLEKIKSLRPDQAKRLAFVTGDVMSPRVAAFLAKAAVPYIEKPVVPSELDALIEQLRTQTAGSEP